MIYSATAHTVDGGSRTMRSPDPEAVRATAAYWAERPWVLRVETDAPAVEVAATREVVITLVGGHEVNATITSTGEIWSPLGAELTRDMIVAERPVDAAAEDETVGGAEDYTAWCERVARMGRRIRQDEDRPRWTYGQAGRWTCS